MNEEKIMEMIREISERVSALEEKNKSLNLNMENNSYKGRLPTSFPAEAWKNDEGRAAHTCINPSFMPDNYIGFTGKFIYENGKVKNGFRTDYCNLKTILNEDAAEICNILSAFSSEERIKILRSLLKSGKTAKTLMEELEFQTTGKLYHHLSFLEKMGALKKREETFYIDKKYIAPILLIFVAVYGIQDSKILDTNIETKKDD